MRALALFRAPPVLRAPVLRAPAAFREPADLRDPAFRAPARLRAALLLRDPLLLRLAPRELLFRLPPPLLFRELLFAICLLPRASRSRAQRKAISLPRTCYREGRVPRPV